MSINGTDRLADQEQASTGERRDSAGPRMQYEALVEVGARSIGGFEAESVDVSMDGIRLRTAYLPQPGENIACRFDGFGGEIIVKGEVAWCRDEGRGGEFGVQFTSVSPEAMDLLRDMCKQQEEAAEQQASDPSAAARGARVRLHIQGLGSPMRARVRDVARGEVLIGSNLEFLRVGRDVELEDVEQGRSRVAHIEHVGVDIDPETNVPQLVVALTYHGAAGDEPGAIASRARVVGKLPPEHGAAEPTEPQVVRSEEDEDLTTAPYRVRQEQEFLDAEPPAETTPEPTVIDKDGDAHEAEAAAISEPPPVARATPRRREAPVEDEAPETLETPMAEEAEVAPSKAAVMAGRAAEQMGALAKKLGPTLASARHGAQGALGKVFAAVRAKRAERQERVASKQPKRTTAPPPSGALRSSGRRLVRDQGAAEPEPEHIEVPVKTDRKRTVVGALLGVMAVLAIYFAASHFRDQAEGAIAEADPSQAVAAADGQPAAPQDGVATANVPLFGATPLSTTEAVPVPPNLDAKGNPIEKPDVGDDDAKGDEDGKEDKAANLPTEWGFGNVVNPTVFRLKMDGTVDGITGKENATGFVLTVPGRKSISSAADLARKDKRVKSLNVVNYPDRAEITVRFKDEVPAFVAKARGKRVIIEVTSPDEKDKKAAKGDGEASEAKADDSKGSKATKTSKKKSSKRSGKSKKRRGKRKK